MLVAICICFAACSTQEDEMTMSQTSSDETSSPKDRQEFWNALDSLTGNPAFTVFGVWGGRRVGQVAGAIICSYLAEKYLCEKKGYSLKNFVNLNPVGNFYVNNDSMGIIHNKVLHSLTQQSSKYGNSSADYEEIYKDCIKLLKQEGIYNDTIATDTKYRKDIIEYSKEIAPLVTSCYEGKISGDALLDSGTKSLT